MCGRAVKQKSNQTKPPGSVKVVSSMKKMWGLPSAQVFSLMYYIRSVNEKLPLTRVHIFLDRELPSVQLSFLWCTVLGIGTAEKVFVRRECTIPFTNEHRVLWELAKWWWLLKVWASLALFDRIIETISMAFSRNIFQAYSGIFVLKIIFSHFDKPRKAQNARAAAAP